MVAGEPEILVSLIPNHPLFGLIGNIGPDDTEYVDGGLYATETPGLSGAAYTSGRGGAGNIAPPSNAGSIGGSDRRDSINEESVIAAPKEGEAFTTGRGGAANVVTAGGEGDKPASAETNGTGKKDVARYGLAYDSLGLLIVVIS
jgi:Protein of unknown function (DUF3602)